MRISGILRGWDQSHWVMCFLIQIRYNAKIKFSALSLKFWNLSGLHDPETPSVGCWCGNRSRRSGGRRKATQILQLLSIMDHLLNYQQREGVFNLFISLPETHLDMYYFALFGTKRDKLLPKLYWRTYFSKE